MNEPADIETRLSEHLAEERERLQAPPGLWAGITARLDATPAGRRRLRRRWPAFAATAGAATALALGLFVLVSYLGGGGSPTADEVLANARDASNDPNSVGLKGYAGTVEINETTTGDSGGTEDSRVAARVWFRAPDQYRAEIEILAPAAQAGRRLLVVQDGEDLWTYEAATNTYSHSEATREPLPVFNMFQAMPLPPGEMDLDDLFDVNQSDGAALREDTLIGRRVYVLESADTETFTWEVPTPAEGMPTDEAVLPPGFTFPPMEMAFRMSMWLDSEYFLLLRMEFSTTMRPTDRTTPVMPTIDVTSETRFTEIELSGDLSDNLFKVALPRDAAQVDQIDLGFESGTYFLGGEDEDEENEAEPDFEWTPAP